MRKRTFISNRFDGNRCRIPRDCRDFDAALASAVKRYQRRNGLHDDGIVGTSTLAMRLQQSHFFSGRRVYAGVRPQVRQADTTQSFRGAG
jgi:hypothetical protein